MVGLPQRWQGRCLHVHVAVGHKNEVEQRLQSPVVTKMTGEIHTLKQSQLVKHRFQKTARWVVDVLRETKLAR